MMNGDITPHDAQAAVRVFKALQRQIGLADRQKHTAEQHGGPAPDRSPRDPSG
jgi:hypothetical protein